MRSPNHSGGGGGAYAGDDGRSKACTAMGERLSRRVLPSSTGASQQGAVPESSAPPESNPPSVSERLARLCAAVRLLVPFTERLDPQADEAGQVTPAEKFHG